jgi:catechol 2,3-dioxygenase-like lactoylglutathione lyase family enzyme
MKSAVEMFGELRAKGRTKDSIVKPRTMSHGTMEVYKLSESRRFYEEFLGLETVKHSVGALAVRCSSSSHVIAIESGQKLRPVHVFNHWGLDLESTKAVDEAHRAAHEYKDKYGIRNIWKPSFQHGIYSFYLEDLDHNWWEYQFYDGDETEDMFDFGDRWTEDGKPL